MPAFNSFGGFAYGFEMLARPIRVSEPLGGSGHRDELGQPVKSYAEPIDLTEPIVNNADPNVTFTNVGGGTVEVGSLVWISRRGDWPMDTLVTIGADKYHTSSNGQSLNAGQYMYQLKEVGSNQQ